jgi:hypothetical protein
MVIVAVPDALGAGVNESEPLESTTGVDEKRLGLLIET